MKTLVTLVVVLTCVGCAGVRAQTTSEGGAQAKEYLAKYTPEHNYEMLMQIYEEAIADQRQNASR